MTQSLIEKGFYFIAGHGRGWAFSANDLMQNFKRNQVDEILSSLCKKEKIRRVARGLYDYPKYSKVLKKDLSPDISQVAQAYARKFNWKIEASGETALNLLGLSTQIPGKYIYLSNGPSKTYTLTNKQKLEFKKSPLKNIGFIHQESSLIVQALRALGKENINNEIIEKIRATLDPKAYRKIKKDTQSSSDWIYEFIKEICRESTNG